MHRAFRTWPRAIHEQIDARRVSVFKAESARPFRDLTEVLAVHGQIDIAGHAGG
jgi:hypothetical protein